MSVCFHLEEDNMQKHFTELTASGLQYKISRNNK